MDYFYVVLLAVMTQVALNVASQEIHYEYGSTSKWMAILATTGVWILTFQRFGWTPTFGILALAESFLITSSVIDLKYKEIPNSYNLIVALLGGGFIYLYRDFYEQLLLGGVIAFSLFLIIMVLTGAMGGGDVKMAGAIGLFMGTGLVMKFITYAFFLGAIIAVTLLILKKKDKTDVFPFGPCIALSGIYMFIFLV
jgi:leader peptidase (prepilin peptidase) / N-methyltransferase